MRQLRQRPYEIAAANAAAAAMNASTVPSFTASASSSLLNIPLSDPNPFSAALDASDPTPSSTTNMATTADQPQASGTAEQQTTAASTASTRVIRPPQSRKKSEKAVAAAAAADAAEAQSNKALETQFPSENRYHCPMPTCNSGANNMRDLNRHTRNKHHETRSYREDEVVVQPYAEWLAGENVPKQTYNRFKHLLASTTTSIPSLSVPTKQKTAKKRKGDNELQQPSSKRRDARKKQKDEEELTADEGSADTALPQTQLNPLQDQPVQPPKKSRGSKPTRGTNANAGPALQAPVRASRLELNPPKAAPQSSTESDPPQTHKPASSETEGGKREEQEDTTARAPSPIVRNVKLPKKPKATQPKTRPDPHSATDSKLSKKAKGKKRDAEGGLQQRASKRTKPAGAQPPADETVAYGEGPQPIIAVGENNRPQELPMSHGDPQASENRDEYPMPVVDSPSVEVVQTEGSGLVEPPTSVEAREDESPSSAENLAPIEPPHTSTEAELEQSSSQPAFLQSESSLVDAPLSQPAPPVVSAPPFHSATPVVSTPQGIPAAVLNAAQFQRSLSPEDRLEEAHRLRAQRKKGQELKEKWRKNTETPFDRWWANDVTKRIAKPAQKKKGASTITVKNITVALASQISPNSLEEVKELCGLNPQTQHNDLSGGHVMMAAMRYIDDLHEQQLAQQSAMQTKDSELRSQYEDAGLLVDVNVKALHDRIKQQEHLIKEHADLIKEQQKTIEIQRRDQARTSRQLHKVCEMENL